MLKDTGASTTALNASHLIRMVQKSNMRYSLDLGLTDVEKYSIGNIVTQWAALEQEVFNQTLASYGQNVVIDELPKPMKNLNFMDVLNHWEERVLPNAHRKAVPVLKKAAAKARELVDFRHAIAHGMFSWEKETPVRLVSSRIKKDQLIQVSFTSESLSSISREIENTLFDFKYPRGHLQYIFEQGRIGHYTSRYFFEMLNSPKQFDK